MLPQGRKMHLKRWVKPLAPSQTVINVPITIDMEMTIRIMGVAAVMVLDILVNDTLLKCLRKIFSICFLGEGCTPIMCIGGGRPILPRPVLRVEKLVVLPTLFINCFNFYL